eukprot:3190283-Pyramimonas_sp.AAC.1
MDTRPPSSEGGATLSGGGDRGRREARVGGEVDTRTSGEQRKRLNDDGQRCYRAAAKAQGPKASGRRHR